MAVSGSKDFALTRAQIVEAALRKMGVFDQGETIAGSDTQNASLQLNMMVKEWSARGIDNWLRDEVTLFLAADQQAYSLGLNGTAHATTEYSDTTLTANLAGGSTTLAVTSSSGMTAADNLGVKLDNNSIHWTTIVSVDSSTQITITTGPSSLASSGKKVYAYTTKAGRPQKLLSAFRRDNNDLDTEVTIIGEEDYRMQANKGVSGPPVQIYYQPTLNTGTLYVWPVDGGASWDKLVFSAQFLTDDFDTASDNPEFPIEWGNALVWNLAAEMAAEYGLSMQEIAYLESKGRDKLDDALAYDVENASMIFSLDARYW
jgi:hypothetical protein